MFTARLSKQEALDLLRYCDDKGLIEIHSHCKKALAEDCLDVNDAWQIIRKGNIFDEPDFDVRWGQWRYRVEGKVTTGQWLVVAFTFLEAEEALVITAFVKKNY